VEGTLFRNSEICVEGVNIKIKMYASQGIYPVRLSQHKTKLNNVKTVVIHN